MYNTYHIKRILVRVIFGEIMQTCFGGLNLNKYHMHADTFSLYARIVLSHKILAI